MNASLGPQRGKGGGRGRRWAILLWVLFPGVAQAQAWLPSDYLIDNGKATLVRYNPQDVGGGLPSSIGPYPDYPYPLVAIGADAFQDCLRVQWLRIPKAVASIHATAFSSCPNLASISVNNANLHFSGFDVLYNKNKTVLLRCPEGFAGVHGVILPDGVRNIAAGACQNCIKATYIRLPDSLTSIGEYAFRGCRSLKSLRIPAHVTAIGDSAFADCAGLKGVLFEGNAPVLAGGGVNLFNQATQATVYVRNGTTGWGATFCGRPVVRYPTADAYEGDDTAGAAKAIFNGQTQRRTIHATGDVDWVTFAIDGAGAQNARLAITGDVETPMEMLLYGPNDSNLFISVVDTNLFFASIQQAALAPGTYWLRIRDEESDLDNPLPHYRLAASWNSPGGDAYEPDNSIAAAKMLANGQTQNRNIHAAGNEDWATFSVGGAGARNVVVETAGASGDTQLWLLGSGGVQIAYDYNSGAGDFSRITVAALPPGTYFVKVREYNNDGTLAAYTLKASWAAVPAAGDAYEPDNAQGAAHGIANGRTQNRSIHMSGDVDWAKFTVGGDGARNVRVETAGTLGDTQLWLYRASGAEIARDDDSGPGNFARISISALSPGTYYVKIREYGNNGTLPRYTLKVVWTEAAVPVDAYEPDETPATARSIRNGQTQRRTIHASGNEDWVRFDVGNGWNNAYNLRLETAGTRGDTQMWLYGPNSATMRVAYDDNSGAGKFSRITVGALAWGTYYIRIREKGNDGRISAYTLRASWTER